MATDKLPNQEQQQAIDYLKGPSLVIAGAGTGKTYVLTEKIKKIVLEKKVNPANILALTFTEKAAFEMEERVDQALPYGYTQTWIMTFHAFAENILRDWGVHIGISPSFKILSEADSVLFFRTQISRFSLNYFYAKGNPTGFIAAALEHFSRLRDENISPTEYAKYVRKFKKAAKGEDEQEEAAKLAELSAMYTRYQELKLEENLLDFSDLIFYLVKLLTKRRNVLTSIRKQFQWGLVDEFQDTNIVQYDLIKLLFPPVKTSRLTVIGDDNQSIYKFRGASVSNILNFQKDYETVKIFVLNRNYRSFQEILDSAYQLITHNNPDTLESKLGISKKLIASRGSAKGAAVTLLCGRDGDAEAEAIVEKIKKLANKGKYQLNDFAILVRANDHAKPIIQALERFGINYQFLGPTLLYYKYEVRDLIALLKYLTDPQDSASLYRVLSMSVLGIERRQLAHLSSFAKRISRSLCEALEILRQPQSFQPYMPMLKEESRNQMLKINDLLTDLLAKAGRESALQILYQFLDQSGYLKKLLHIKSSRDEERLNNITRFFNRMKKMTGEGGEVTVREAVDNINLALELGDTPRVEDFAFERENAVNILTAHGAKGLEFPVVFLANLVTDRFPTRRRREKLPIPEALIKESLPQGDYHLQEERRLFYVAVTRAKDRLFFSFASFYNAGRRERKLSSFVLEALGEEMVRHFMREFKNQEHQLAFFEPSPVPQKLVALPPKDYGIAKYSYTQIETFERCPKQYEFRYLLRVPEPESAALSFGSSVHKALELFYKDKLQGKRPTLNLLLKYFQENFVPLGYLNKPMLERAHADGERVLKHYFRHWYQPRQKVLAVEQNFMIKLGNAAKPYNLTGKIDRIDRNNGITEIIDYKTGKMPDPRKLKHSLQLNIYAIAAMDKSLLGLPPKAIRLTFLYLEQGERYSQKASERNLEKTKETIFNDLQQMETGRYPPNIGRHCDWCPFKIICPAWEN